MHFFEGMIINEMNTCENGPRITVTDEIILVMLGFEFPTKEEIEAFECKPVTIGFTSMRDTIFFTAKIGQLDLIDMPMSPHLCENLTDYSKIEGGKPFVILLVDTSSGRVEKIKLIGLYHNFYNSFIEEAKKLKNKPFDKEKHIADVSEIYAKFSSIQLHEKAIATAAF